MSQTTKKALAESLKKLLETTTLDHVTVKQLVEECEVNRQTFYYHFQDIFDLVEWIYSYEASKVLKSQNPHTTWQSGLQQILELMVENKAFVENTLGSEGKEYLERYIYAATKRILIEYAKEQLGDTEVSEEGLSFMADFCKYGFVGIISEWIHKGMKEEPAHLTGNFEKLLSGNVLQYLEHFE